VDVSSRSFVRHEDGIVAIAVPVPLPIVRSNAYLIGTKDSAMLVDCGTNWEKGLKAIQSAADELGLRPDTIVVTHLHVDHFGGSGALQRAWDARVMLGEEDAREAAAFYRNGAERNDVYRLMYLRNGAPLDGVASTISTVEGIRRLVDFPAISRMLRDGDRVRVGDIEFEVVVTPGHSSGHICLFDRRRGILLSGDHLLPRISPNVGLSMREGFNPVASYLASLARIAGLGVRLAYPGHGDPISDVDGRIREIVTHHYARAARIMDIIEETPMTAWDVALKLFGEGLDPFQMRFAMAEAAAHLEWLAAEGWVEATGEEVLRYRPVRRDGGLSVESWYSGLHRESR